MAHINITQKHKLTHKKAKAAAQKVADKLAEEHGMECEWDGDVLLFKRSGVSGKLVLEEHAATIEITLGFLLMAFAGKIEEEVGKSMKKVFAAKE
ncbi:MAG TPA: polyhydroxyalkanoic acid system family protein [Paucimonas sp.]|nr:polyhydroxyalkanoic acid system family protein [Paucimonas sp.]